MAAVLEADYELSIAKDMGMAIDSMSVTGFAHYEANTTGTVVVTTSSSPTIALKACGKWDFQLHAVAPIMQNGWALLVY